MSDCPVMTVYDSGGESKTPPPIITIRINNTTEDEVYQICKFINSYLGIEYRVDNMREDRRGVKYCDVYLMNSTRAGEAMCQMIVRTVKLENRMDDHDTAIDELIQRRISGEK